MYYFCSYVCFFSLVLPICETWVCFLDFGIMTQNCFCENVFAFFGTNRCFPGAIFRTVAICNARQTNQICSESYDCGVFLRSKVECCIKEELYEPIERMVYISLLNNSEYVFCKSLKNSLSSCIYFTSIRYQ